MAIRDHSSLWGSAGPCICKARSVRPNLTDDRLALLEVPEGDPSIMCIICSNSLQIRCDGVMNDELSVGISSSLSLQGDLMTSRYKAYRIGVLKRDGVVTKVLPQPSREAGNHASQHGS